MKDVVDNISLGVVLLNRDGQVKYANEFCKNRGIILQDFSGRKYYEAFRSLELINFVGEVLEGRKRELRFEHAGRVYRATPLKAGLAIQIEDITELVRVEKLQREFSASVSHELSTPITAVRGLLETALSDNNPDKALLERALKRIVEIERLVKALRYLVSLEGENSAPDESISLKGLLEGIAQDLREAAEVLGVVVELVCDESEIKTNRERLYILLRNVVENAVKHNRKGGRVYIECRKTPEGVEISVKDTGEGIAKEDLPFLFQPFYKGKGKRGTGLGLTIAKRAADSLSAGLEIDSGEGSGTTVRILLRAHTSNL